MTNNNDPLPSDNLKSRIERARNEAGLGPQKEQSAAATAFQVSAELLSGVAVGMVSGYFLDKWLHTKPIFFLICFVFGAIAGGYNIYRSMQNNTNDLEP